MFNYRLMTWCNPGMSRIVVCASANPYSHLPCLVSVYLRQGKGDGKTKIGVTVSVFPPTFIIKHAALVVKPGSV